MRLIFKIKANRRRPHERATVIQIELNEWPLLRMTFCGGSASVEEARQFLHTLEDIVARGEPFAMVVTTDGASPLPKPEQQQLAAWLRRHKQTLRALCTGMVRIQTRSGLLARLSAKALQAAYPFPIYIAAEEAEAVAWAKSRLPRAT